jgi:hypothetical protein
MTGQEALRIIDRLLDRHQRYKTIARELGYEPEYIKQAASHLWQLLSAIFGQKVSKSNLCSILQAGDRNGCYLAGYEGLISNYFDELSNILRDRLD